MTRDPAIDRARGLAILAVAWFHMTRALINTGHMADGPLLQWADRLAYGWHVQIFFLVSGYFLQGRVRRWADVWPRALDLYWPYLLWSTITAVLLLAMPASGSALRLSDVIVLPVIPFQHYWFLLYLIVCIALMALVGRWPLLVTGLFLVANLVAWRADLPQDRLGVTLDNGTYWPAFFFFGAWLARRGALLRWRTGPALFAFAVAALAALASVRSGIDIRWSLFFVPSLCACYALVWLASRLAVPGLAWLGQRSLPIYLVHVMVGAVLRALVYRVVPGIPVALAFAVIFGGAVAIPVVLDLVATRLGLARLAGFAPIVKVRRSGPAPAASAA